jgi:DNA modification methylase
MQTLIRANEIKHIPINELKPHPKNPNKHGKDQIDRLADIIRYQGFRRPITVSNLSGYVTVGHGRIEAAKKLGMEFVPVTFQDYDDDTQEYADIVADNAIDDWAELDFAMVNAEVPELGPDFDIDLLGIRDFEIEPADKYGDADAVPEPPKVAKSKLGDLWILGNHRLLCGDSTKPEDVARLFGDASCEICFTSPPYADQREYNGGKNLSTEHLAKFIRMAREKTKYFAVNLGYSRKDGEVNQYWDDYIKEARSCGLKLLSWNVWDKMECGSIGNQSAFFGICHEWIFIFGKEYKQINKTVETKWSGTVKTKKYGHRDSDGSLSYRDNSDPVSSKKKLETIIHQSPLKARNHGIDHPAMFPVELPEKYLECMTDHGENIYEPFGGSGTTLIAAEKLGRNCLTMELDPVYCDVILERWSRFSGLDPSREDGKKWSELRV